MFVTFIQQAYGPIVFDTFYKPQFYYGSLHLFNYLKNAMACLDEPHFEFVKDYFLINSYWWHPENVLVCALICPLVPLRIKKQALQIILEAYDRWENNDGEVRYFILPTEDQLNFKANHFFYILRWKALPIEYITFPPILQMFTRQELKDSIKDNNFHTKLPQFLCHTQKCEEWVKKTADSVKRNIGKERQLGNMVASSESREKWPLKKVTKANYL